MNRSPSSRFGLYALLKRGTLALLAGMLLYSMPARAASSCISAYNWPLWQQFAGHFIQADGRVVDYSTPNAHSTSEGQSYAMLFALIAGDRASFDRLWRWSVANLAGGDIRSRLPAWQWGRRNDGQWGILDPNAASDADLWFIYSLLEAGRLWQQPQYTADAQTLLGLVTQQEVVDLPGLGKMLLPGPQGFVLANGLVRLNPSYLPIPLLRRLALADPNGPWNEMARNTVRMLRETSPLGFSADWVGYQITRTSTASQTGMFVVDPVKADLGSYDAIRTYLWAGMTPKSDPLAANLMQALGGMAESLTSQNPPPEKILVKTGQRDGNGPVGFSAALLPYLKSGGQNQRLIAQRQRAATLLASASPPLATYYDHVLGLFGLGWDEQHYQFRTTGHLQLRWEKACQRANVH